MIVEGSANPSGVARPCLLSAPVGFFASCSSETHPSATETAGVPPTGNSGTPGGTAGSLGSGASASGGAGGYVGPWPPSETYSNPVLSEDPLGPDYTMNNQRQFFMGYRDARFNCATVFTGGRVTVRSFEVAVP